MMTNEQVKRIKVSELPSKGIPYPKDYEIEYSPYTFGDISHASLFEEPDIAEILPVILDGIHTNFDKDLLTYQDALFIGVLRKITAFGEVHATLYSMCPSCGNKNSKEFTLFDLDFDELGTAKLPIKTKISGKEMVFSALTLKSVLELDSSEDSSILAACVTNVEYNEALDIISSATGKDVLKLQEIDRMLYHGIKPLQMVCSSCKEGYTAEADAPDVLIRPFQATEESIRDEISYGS